MTLHWDLVLNIVMLSDVLDDMNAVDIHDVDYMLLMYLNNYDLKMTFDVPMII